jgi:beta-N-acetylhexosaminidase
VLDLKQRLGLLEPGWQPAAAMPDAGALAADRTLALDAATRAVTLLSCSGAVPIEDRAAVIGVEGPARALASDLPDAIAVPVAFDPTAAQRQAAVAAARSSATVVVLTYDANASAAQRTLLQALSGTGRPLIVVSIDLPYDLGVSVNASARLATYGAGDISMAGLARALTNGDFSGRLPVSVPAAGGMGRDFGAGQQNCG